MSVNPVGSTAYLPSPYQAGPAQPSSDFDPAGRSQNQAALSAQNARTPSDLQAVQFRQERSNPEPVAEPVSLDSATGVLGGSLTQDQQDTLNSLSSLLDTDAQSLQNSLQNGSTLADLAQEAGVNARALASVSQDGLLFDTSV